MSYEEEREIAFALQYLGKVGQPISRPVVSDIVKSFIENIGRDSVFKHGKPGLDWIYGFEERHSDILTRRKPESLTMARAKALTTQVRDEFFEMWTTVLEENGLTNAPERIFNLDETGLNTDATSGLVYTRKG